MRGKLATRRKQLPEGLDRMAVITVYDNSEAVELSSSYRLYLKPKAKLVITVILPGEMDPCRPVSSWEILEQLKNLVLPDHFSSIRVTRTTKEFIRIEGEADTTQLAQIFLEKLQRQLLKISSFNDPLSVEVTEAPSEFPTYQELQSLLSPVGGVPVKLAENGISPPTIHLEGLPCKWFSTCGSSTEKPDEDIVRTAFEKYGKLTNLDIPMLDPYREEATGNFNLLNPGGLQTFEAFLLYEERSNCIDAMQSLQGMKLLFTGEDGKSLACDIKVSLDTTNHFSEEAVNKRNAERLKLQELEQQRKQEKEDEEVEAERKRKAEERKFRMRKRRAKLKRKAQKQRPCKDNTLEEGEVCSDGVEDTQEWEDRKLLLAQRRVESINLLTLLLDRVNDLVKMNKLNEEEVMACDFIEDSSDSSISTYSHTSKSLAFILTEEEGSNPHEADCKGGHGDVAEKHKAYSPRGHSLRKWRTRPANSLALKNNLDFNSDQETTQEADRDQLEATQKHYFDHHNFKASHSSDTLNEGYCKKRKVYETDEFINYLLNYYNYPEYARFFLESKESVSNSWCQRVVHFNGNSFQIKLINTNGHFTEMECKPKLDHETDNDDCGLKRTVQKSDENLEGTSNSRSSSKEIQNIVDHTEPKVPAERTIPCLIKEEERVHSETWQDEECSQLSESNHELKDVLEEISSTSEYFSEELSGATEKRSNSRKISRRQRNISYMKRTKPCSLSGLTRICKHEDILGHLLQTYSACNCFKKHSKCNLTRGCPKANVGLYYDGGSSESDTDEEDRLQWNRKRMKKTPSSCSQKYRNRTTHSQRMAGVQEPHNQKGYMWEKRHSSKHKKACCEAEYHGKSKKKSSHWENYAEEEDESECTEKEKYSWDSDRSSSWSSSSPDHQTGETEQSAAYSKASFSDCLDWEHHFYRGKGSAKDTKHQE